MLITFIQNPSVTVQDVKAVARKLKPMARKTMSERIKISVPTSILPTIFEVWEYGKKKRVGAVQPGALEMNVKITAPREDCEIRIIACDHLGRPTGCGHVYKDDILVPAPPENTDPPVEECCGEPETCEQPEMCPEPERFTEATEIEADAEASVVLEKADEPTVSEEPAMEYDPTKGYESNNLYKSEDE